MALRLVLVGDDAAGKTSLVSCVVNDSFQEKQPVPVLPEVAAPADLQVSSAKGIILVDTSNKPAARLHLQQVSCNHLFDVLLAVLCHRAINAPLVLLAGQFAGQRSMTEFGLRRCVQRTLFLSFMMSPIPLRSRASASGGCR